MKGLIEREKNFLIHTSYSLAVNFMHTEKEIFTRILLNKINSDCNNTFPIDLTST